MRVPFFWDTQYTILSVKHNSFWETLFFRKHNFLGNIFLGNTIFSGNTIFARESQFFGIQRTFFGDIKLIFFGKHKFLFKRRKKKQTIPMILLICWSNILIFLNPSAIFLI